MGNGVDTASWKDYWSSDINLANMFPDLFNLCLDPDISVKDCRLLHFRRNFTGALVDKYQELQMLKNGVHFHDERDNFA